MAKTIKLKIGEKVNFKIVSDESNLEIEGKFILIFAEAEYPASPFDTSKLKLTFSENKK